MANEQYFYITPYSYISDGKSEIHINWKTIGSAKDSVYDSIVSSRQIFEYVVHMTPLYTYEEFNGDVAKYHIIRTRLNILRRGSHSLNDETLKKMDALDTQISKFHIILYTAIHSFVKNTSYTNETNG